MSQYGLLLQEELLMVFSQLGGKSSYLFFWVCLVVCKKKVQWFPLPHPLYNVTIVPILLSFQYMTCIISGELTFTVGSELLYTKIPSVNSGNAGKLTSWMYSSFLPSPKDAEPANTRAFDNSRFEEAGRMSTGCWLAENVLASFQIPSHFTTSLHLK